MTHSQHSDQAQPRRRPIEIVAAFQDALAARDVDQYVAHLAENITVEEPGMPRLEGRPNARALFEGLAGACREIVFLERKLYAVDRSVGMRFALRLTSTAGGTATLEGVEIFDLNEQGEIERIKAYYDPSPLAGLAGV
jgi:limonene-1,2-epoxide hydrolase